MVHKNSIVDLQNKDFIITEDNVAEYVRDICEYIRGIVYSAGRRGVVLGMSGGIDCCVVARLCQEAGVPVKLIVMPDGDNMDKSRSMNDAMMFINEFCFDYKIINIEEACYIIETLLGEPIDDLASMNIRPRVRMILLYALAQMHHCFVVGTGNFVERMLGYFTKHGDGASDFNPNALFLKREIRILAKYLGVPDRIISKAPSPDLTEGQTDEAEIGATYDEMDGYCEFGASGDEEKDKILERRVLMSIHKITPISIYRPSDKMRK